MLETAWSVPFFLLSWFACGAWYAIVAGRDMAEASEESKQAILDGIFGKGPKP
jgi:hypothetical protein